MKPGEPVIVCLEDEEIVLTDEEKDLLTLGPKLCVRNRLCETDLEVCMTDLEVCIMKYGWEVMGESEEEKNRRNLENQLIYGVFHLQGKK